jgi:ABC-2 type transport system permease protein
MEVVMQISLQRLGALIRRETIQLLRDRRFVMLVLGLPMIQLFLYAYAASLTVYHLPTAVVDQSQDTTSRYFVQTLVNSQYFDPTAYPQSEAEARQAIERGNVKAAIIIPPRFAANVDTGRADVLFLFDGSDSFAVRSGYSAASLVVQNYGLQLAAQKVMRGGSGGGSGSESALGALPILASTRVLYNPDLTDLWFILPGIIGLIVQTLAIEQAAMFLVRDREFGMLEQILATPARSLELIVSKLVPMLTLCILVLGVSVALGIFWFGVPFQGSLGLYLLLSLTFIAACLGLGLLVSTRVSTQREAQASANIFVLLGVLLSGLFYPRASMPLIPQLIGDLSPLTYFIRISRGIFTKGVGMNFLWSDALVLFAYCLVVILVAARRFKKRLD